MSVFVGLDCGGSSSRVLAVNSEGDILFQGTSGAANLASTPDGRIRRNLEHATNGSPSADYVCGCFAGLVSDELRVRAEDYLRRIYPRAYLRAEPDYTAAFYAAPDGTDVCVIAGTGTLVCSRSEHGLIKSGGRGFLLGDYGSGYQYGRDALLHYLDDPHGASDSLKRLVVEVFETSQEGAIIAEVYRSSTPATLLGRLSKALAADAKAEEEYALKSVRKNTRMLADVVLRHITRYLPGRKQLAISLAGGVWKAAPVFRDTFALMIEEGLMPRDVAVTRVTRPPLYGAVELAKEMNNIGN